MDWPSPWTVAAAVAAWGAAQGIEKWRIAHFESIQRAQGTRIGKLDGTVTAHDTRLFVLERAMKEAEERSASQTAKLLDELRQLRQQIHDLFMAAWKATPPSGKAS